MIMRAIILNHSKIEIVVREDLNFLPIFQCQNRQINEICTYDNCLSTWNILRFVFLLCDDDDHTMAQWIIFARNVQNMLGEGFREYLLLS